MRDDFSISLHGCGAWPDLLLATVGMARVRGIAMLEPPEGAADGLVALRLETLAGQPFFATLTWPALYRTVQTLATCYGPPLDDD